MSTAFVHFAHSSRSVYLTALAIIFINLYPPLLTARDLFPPSQSVQILRKAALVKLIPVRHVIPDIAIDLKYATSDNITNHALYPPDMPCLLHRMTLDRLKRAQKAVKKKGLRLKIWDAYRPPEAQLLLWKATKSSRYVVPPEKGPSLHSYGAAVDVTLIHKNGEELLMPTKHDEFSPAAASDYKGDNLLIRYNLDILQKAMKKAGFSTIKDEWWHFTNMEPQAAKVVTAKQLGIQLHSHQSADKSSSSSKP